MARGTGADDALRVTATPMRDAPYPTYSAPSPNASACYPNGRRHVPGRPGQHSPAAPVVMIEVSCCWQLLPLLPPRQKLLPVGPQLALGRDPPVKGLPGDAQFLAQPPDLGLRLTHRGHRKAQLCRRHLVGPPTLAPARPRRGEPRHRALGDELPFELRQRREDSEDQLAGGRGGVDGRPLPGEDLEPDGVRSWTVLTR